MGQSIQCINQAEQCCYNDFNPGITINHNKCNNWIYTMKTHVRNNQAGFTLIEVIVVFVVAGIMASMIYTYFGSALTQSSVPINRLKSVSRLYMVMENIVADYNRLNGINLRYKWVGSIPYHIGSIVTPRTILPTPNGSHYYRCTATGTSGTTEPT
jgi:prepilin-type N-terminal cleavage/methylation domain-containing protein